MRYLLGLVASLLASGLTQAEVVISSTSNGASSTSVGTAVMKSFTTTASPYWSITNLSFGLNISGSPSSVNYTSITAYLYSNTSGTTYSQLASYNFGSFTNTANTDYFFNADPGSGWQNLSGSANYLIALEAVGSSTGGSINWLQASPPDTGAWASGSSSKFYSGGPTLPNSFDFNTATTAFPSGTLYLGVSAVPEPGTLLLGGIAAACGGTGVWWKRRKRLPQPETTEQPAAI